MAVALDASSPAAVYGDTNSNGSLVTASFTPPNGSIVVAKVVSGDAAQTHTSVTGLTFTSRTNAGTSGTHTRVSIWTATGLGASITVTAAFSAANTRGLLVEVWTGAQLAGTPAVNSTLRGSVNTAPSASITTAAANSVVSWICGDWSAIDGTASKAYRSSAVETSYKFLSGQYSRYCAYQQAVSAGAQTYGLTLPLQDWNLGAIEIQSSGGAPAIPPSLIMPPWR